MHFRDAAPADAPAIAALRERTIRTVVAASSSYSPAEIDAWASNYTPERVAGFIAQGNYLVAEESGRILAIGRLHLDAPDAASIRGIFVDADFIGRGIGAEILTRLVAIAAKLGVSAINLTATLNACSFYQRHAFRCLAAIQHTTPNGSVIPAFLMRRDAPFS